MTPFGVGQVYSVISETGIVDFDAGRDDVDVETSDRGLAILAEWILPDDDVVFIVVVVAVPFF